MPSGVELTLCSRSPYMTQQLQTQGVHFACILQDELLHLEERLPVGVGVWEHARLLRTLALSGQLLEHYAHYAQNPGLIPGLQRQCARQHWQPRA